jgi:hypothetical protein
MMAPRLALVVVVEGSSWSIVSASTSLHLAIGINTFGLTR